MLRKIGAVLALPLAKLWQNGKAIFPIIFLGLFFALPAKASWVDSVLTGVASIITTVASMIGKVVVLVIGGVLMPAATYNDFVNSPVVGAGWAVIRDAVNMFFVVVFIAIAFGTILGLQKFQWRQQVPRLLLVAVFINFSRMFCGLAIDFSQVFMMTFINAVKDIAGGNFIQMFGLGDIMSGSSSGETGSDGGAVLMAAMVALVMMLIVLVTVVFMCIAFLYRIVMLWVLVTVAPLAWFTKALDGIMPTGNKAYVDWWKKFLCTLMLGPILAFFLWLALAVAGSGGEISGFDNVGTPEVNVFSKILGSSRLITFIVGIFLLFAGLDTANLACAGADKTMGSLLGAAKKTSKAIASAPVAAAGGIAGAAGVMGVAAARKGLEAGKGLGKWGYRQSLGRGVNIVKDSATDIASKLADDKKLPSFFRGAASNFNAKGLADRAARAEARVGTPRNSKQILNEYDGSKFSSLNADKRQQTIAEMKQVMSDPSALKDPAQLAQLQGFLNSTDSMTGKKVMNLVQDTYKGDAGFKKQMEETKKTAPSLFGQDQIKETLSKDLQPNDAKDAVAGLLGSQFSDAGVMDQLKEMKIYARDADSKVVKKDGVAQEISAYEAMEKGTGGFSSAQMKAFAEGKKALESRPQESEEAKAAKAIASGGKDVDAWRGRVKPNEVLAAGLQGKDVAGRAAFRQNLAQSGLLSRKATDDEILERDEALWVAQGEPDRTREKKEVADLRLKQATAEAQAEAQKSSGVLESFDFRADGRFEDDAAKTDFSAAVGKDPQLLFKALRQSAAQSSDGKPALDLVRQLSPEVVKNLFKKAKTTTGDERGKVIEDLNSIFSDLATDETSNSAIDVERNSGQDSSELIRNIESIKGLAESFANLKSANKQSAAGANVEPSTRQKNFEEAKKAVDELAQKISSQTVGGGKTLGEAQQDLETLQGNLRQAEEALAKEIRDTRSAEREETDASIGTF